MTFYARKPHRIEARQVTMGEIVRVADWCGGQIAYTNTGDPIGVLVQSRGRSRLCFVGDYLTCDAHGSWDTIEGHELAVGYDLARDPVRA